MPIIKEVPRPCLCENKPDVLYGLGTIWQCDKCGQQFELRDEQRDGLYWAALRRGSNWFGKQTG